MPKTLEEALALIGTLQTQVQSLTDDKKKILDEKKGVLDQLKLKEADMTENEKALLSVLESERASRLELEQRIESENKARQDAENTRISTAIEDRITKIAKGDTKVADELRANVALLEKMPRNSDAEIDGLLGAAWNMRGVQEANPLATINNTSGGQPKVDEKPTFASTEAGKNVASALGLTHVAKAGEGDDKK